MVIGGGPGAGNGAFYVDGGTAVADTIRLNQGGHLGGVGVVLGTTIHNGGTVAPGFSPGELTLDGDYIQSGEGELQLELFGDPGGTFLHDRVVFGDSISLQGRVRFVMTGEAAPSDLTLMNLSDFLTLAAGNTQPPFDLSQADVGGVIGDLEFDVDVDPDGAFTVGDVPTGTGGTDPTLVPRLSALRQNQPNPFNSVTTIPFDLSAARHVTLTVYNVRGQRVETLINGTYPAGFHSFQWRAADIPSGIYFYRLEAGSFKEVRKMLL